MDFGWWDLFHKISFRKRPFILIKQTLFTPDIVKFRRTPKFEEKFNLIIFEPLDYFYSSKNIILMKITSLSQTRRTTLMPNTH